MPETDRVIRCGGCKQILEDSTYQANRIPCSNCGSLQRHIFVSFNQTIRVHTKARIKARHSNGEKPYFESVQGDDLHRKSGKWMILERSIDRENNWYHEKITDPKTDEVVHETAEPLSEHQGHGSARRYES